MHLLPVFTQQLALKLPQRVLCRTQDVAPPASPQKPHIFLARQTTVHNPDSPGSSVELFHVPHDLFERGGIVAVAGEHLITQGHPATAHHQRDIHLLAVRAMISRIAPLRLRVAFRLSLEVRAGDVVEQQVVVQIEQFAKPLLQEFLERFLVGQQNVQRSIQAIFVYLLLGHTQQIRHRAGLVEVLGQMQFAGRFTQPTENQNHGHC